VMMHRVRAGRAAHALQVLVIHLGNGNAGPHHLM
jgi:hypothetical protein